MSSPASSSSIYQRLEPFIIDLKSLITILAAVVLQIEAVLFALGLHPGYLIHRFRTSMQRLTSVFGYGNVNLQGQSRSNREDDAIGKVVNRDKARIGLRKRRAVLADVQEQG
jgi:hypothetical protein